MKITEYQLKETVSDMLNNIDISNNNKTITVKEYKQNVDALRFQLVETYCLSKYYQLFNPKSNDFKYWIKELTYCINSLKTNDIKKDKRTILRKMLIDDYDYNNANMILRIIDDKFNSENINDNNTQKIIVAKAFTDDIQNIIDIIADDNKDVNIKEKIMKMFQME